MEKEYKKKGTPPPPPPPKKIELRTALGKTWTEFIYKELILRLARGGLYSQLLIKSPQFVNLGSLALSLGLV